MRAFDDPSQADFRTRAVAASEALRRTLPSGVSLAESGHSYCVERQPSLSHLRVPVKIVAVACAVLGISGLAIGGILALLAKSDVIAEESTLLSIAVFCSAGGILLMFLPVFFERHILRQHLPQPETRFGAESNPAGIHVALEYAPTYGSMKILAEDIGRLYIDRDAHYIKVDGLSYEYVIQSRDLAGLSRHKNRKSVVLSYDIEEERLEIVIEPRSLLAELERQTRGESRGLFLKIQAALEPNAR